MALFQNAVLNKYLAGINEEELKKKKVELSLNEEADWMEYFNQQKSKADQLKSQISQTVKEIDRMVYELYGLSEEEVGVVEGDNSK